MSAPQPSVSKWDLALDGIAELGRKIDALASREESERRLLADRQEDLQDQLNGLRASYTRAAPMQTVMGLEGRVAALETGVAARILAHMEADERERKERQKLVDERHERDRAERAAGEKRTTRRVWLIVAVLAVVVLALLALAGVVVWVELRA